MITFNHNSKLRKSIHICKYFFKYFYFFLKIFFANSEKWHCVYVLGDKNILKYFYFFYFLSIF